MENQATRCRASSPGSTTAPTDQNVMTLEEAAIFQRCDPITVKRRAKVLNMPYRRIGSLWRFYRPSLAAWMALSEAGNDKAA
ncbi:MAG TPA: hypothetical protein VMV57_01440 [Terracidiphilus sp.]|nr:hypothetical protein [Terracidiphilus sp.]